MKLLKRSPSGFILGLICKICAALTFSACTTPDTEEPSAPLTSVEVEEKTKGKINQYELFAVSSMEPKSNSKVQGKVEFRKHPKGILVLIAVRGVESAGPRGIHIHEHGDCSAADASSAGSHFNPTDEQHGKPNSDSYHFGDLGNIEIDETGQGKKALILQKAKQKNLSEQLIVGRSVILHAKEDKFTQPVGDAGGRIACGVIRSVSK